MIVATLIVVGVAFGSGLWLGSTKPAVTLVTLVPGTPVALSIDGGPESHNVTYIATLLRDLNGYPRIAPGMVSSCLSDPFFSELRFTYANGDRLSVGVVAGCGPTKGYAAYASDLGAFVEPRVVNDLSTPPAD